MCDGVWMNIRHTIKYTLIKMSLWCRPQCVLYVRLCEGNWHRLFVSPKWTKNLCFKPPKCAPSWREMAAGCSAAMRLRLKMTRQNHGETLVEEGFCPNDPFISHWNRPKPSSCLPIIQVSWSKGQPWKRSPGWDQSSVVTNNTHATTHKAWRWKVNTGF